MLKFKPIMRWAMFLLLLFSQSCSSELNIPGWKSNEKSTPNSIQALRRVKLYETLVFGKTDIRAIVTSDIDSRNFSSKELIVQDLSEEAAIVLNLNFDNSSIKLGDIIKLNLENTKLQNDNGELVVTQVDQSNIQIESSNNSITPKTINIASILTNAKYWGPLFVKIDKINIVNSQNNFLQGDLLIDDEIVEMRAQFSPQSIFAAESNPAFVQAMKGVLRIDEQGVSIVPRNLSDIQIGLLELLEDFEQSSNTNYDSKVMNFVTGQWTISGGITATSTSDPKNGKQSIRLQGTVNNVVRTGILAMNFDLKGVKTVSVSHGIYPAAAELANPNPTVFKLEMSKDGGKTYTSVGTAEVDLQSRSLATTVFPVNNGFSEDARFRVVNTSQTLPNSTNKPRINIDDIFFTF